MNQQKLEYLQKKYESRLNPSDKEELKGGPGRGRGPGPGHGPGGPGRGMPGGKPKNMKKTLGRLFSWEL